MRKTVSVLLYVISGFFLYMVCVFAFVNKPPIPVKFAMMGGFCIPALIALVIGLACNRFENWKRDIGIVMASAAGLTAFVALSMACLLLDAEFRKFFPENEMDIFSDYISGVGCIVIIAMAGIILIRISKSNSNDHINPASNLRSTSAGR